MGAVGIAVDHASLYRHQVNLQGSVDTAALATVREMSLIGRDAATLNNIAKSYLFANSGENHSTLSVKTEVNHKDQTVKVSVSKVWEPMFAHYLDATMLPIKVSATAKLMGSGNICVIGLNEERGKTVGLQKNARLVGNGCGLYSNSKHKSSIKVGKGSEIDAKFICSSGGIKGREKATFKPTPVVDCPGVADPLARRSPPTYLGCLRTDFKLKDTNAILKPGVYCGGLKISGNSNITLQKGIYIIKDGKLSIEDGVSLTGLGVGFYLTGKDAKIDLKKKTSIRLSAMEDGLMAGILFWEDRNSPLKQEHKITSDDARLLLGTIYLSRGSLVIDSDGPVADQSAYTAIIANTLFLEYGPTLILNSDYAASNVPVPESLIGGKVRLVK